MTGWYRQMRDVHALLTGPSASVRLVLTPERVVIAEARRTWTSLGLYGFAVDGVVVNRVFPAAGPGRGDAWRRSWNEAQQIGLDEVAESFAELPVVRAPYLAAEPIGPDALDDLAGRLSGDVTSADDPLGVLGPVRHEGLRVRRSGSGYVLSLPLPLANARDVDLKRRDAELLVSVGDHRRVLSLPAVLQRCVVGGARVRDGVLRVTFVPDPELWPVGLGAGPVSRTAGRARRRYAGGRPWLTSDARWGRWRRRRPGCSTPCWPGPGAGRGGWTTARATTHTGATPPPAEARAERGAVPDLWSRARYRARRRRGR